MTNVNQAAPGYKQYFVATKKRFVYVTDNYCGEMEIIFKCLQNILHGPYKVSNLVPR